jgi:Ni/Co efflux regulator RcnB
MLKRFGILGLVVAGSMFFHPAAASAQDWHRDHGHSQSYRDDSRDHRDYDRHDRHERREWREHKRHERREREWRERSRWSRRYNNYYPRGYYSPGYYQPRSGFYFSWQGR